MYNRLLYDSMRLFRESVITKIGKKEMTFEQVGVANTSKDAMGCVGDAFVAKVRSSGVNVT